MSGVVLAGGSSTRMGTDKALLTVEGQRLVDRAVATLAVCCESVMVASGARTIRGLEVPQLADALADGGPLAGILAAMAGAETSLLAVLAVDMPRASAGVFELLAEQWRDEAVIIPVADGRAQPLHAVWAVAARTRLQAMLDGG